jgi:hypothetical protein
MVCRSLHVLFLGALAISILPSFSVAAQGGLTGGLTGVITDPNGGELPNATVIVCPKE